MRVRIKKTPRTGDQRDYSLITHRPWSPSNTEDPDAVKNTIGAVPRHLANIEAEGGETVLGDINGDGNIEHMTITGKRHTQGGVPLNVPAGSFIFSDTKKMRIKDKAVLEHFGMGGKKTGYTPAEIAKRYQLNEFMKKVNDPSADPFTRRTAERMLNNNMQKLSELAAYQEGMKGKESPTVSQQMLPDGGQGFNEAAYPMMDEEMDELEMAYGGMIKMQNAGTVPPKIGSVYYLNGQPIKLSRYEDDSFTDYLTPNFMADPGGVYFKDAKNNEVYLDYDQFKELRDKGAINTKGSSSTSWWTGDGVREYQFSTKPGGAAPGLKVKNMTFNVGDTVTTRKGTFKITNPQGMVHPNSYYTAMEVVGPNGKKEYISAGSIIEDMQKGLAEVKSVNPGSNSNNESSGITNVYYNNVTGEPYEVPVGQQPPPGYSPSKSQKKQTAPVVTSAPKKNVGSTPSSLPKKTSNVKVYESVDDLYNDKWQELQDKAMGGQLYAEGGVIESPKYKYDPVQRKMIPIMQTAGTTPGDEKEFVEEYEVKGQGKHKRITKGNTIPTPPP